jgi:2-dehydro-3-deoxyphosphogluconate aldolase/(4S)-4-hydroxy-2-oxoglutarate aldolase
VTPAAQVYDAIAGQRALAIVRLDGEAEAVAACKILAGAGMQAVEVSLAARGAAAALTTAAHDLAGDAFVGAGTVRTLAQATAAVGAGAAFLVGPALDETVAAWAKEHDVLYLPGALTPTEVEAASRWSPLVKLFPAVRLGPGYVRDLLAPFPDAALVATGGIDLQNAQEYLEAGAFAVALGSALVSQAGVAAPDDLAANARRLLQLGARAAPGTRPKRPRATT